MAVALSIPIAIPIDPDPDSEPDSKPEVNGSDGMDAVIASMQTRGFVDRPGASWIDQQFPDRLEQGFSA
jgi:hypothetical protein